MTEPQETQNQSEPQERTPAANIRDFDPARHLSSPGGREYLEVKWRLVWLRQREPGADIDTALVEHKAGDYAVFRCRVTLPDGAGGSGYGSETSGDFRDYLEKAETKAIGRALASLGFGTQFSFDFDYEGVNPEKPLGGIVDSPVDFASTRGRRLEGAGQPQNRGPVYAARGNGGGGRDQTVTPRQIKFISALAMEAGLSEEEVRAELIEKYDGKRVEDLSRREASAYIEGLQGRRVYGGDPYP